MIEFQDILEETQTLKDQIAEQIKLIRALANFHVDRQLHRNVDELHNQRTQLMRAIKELEHNLARLTDSQEQVNSSSNADIAYDPEEKRHADVVDKFIELAVPPDMQSVWKPDSFTGSLLVLFENGKIESSSLIEKKPNRVHNRNRRVSSQQNESESPEPVTVVEEPFDSFTILKSPRDSKMHVYFTLDAPANVFVIIYNELQQVVRQIEKSFDRPGDYSVTWDGLDDDGNEVPKGRYYCQLQIGGSLSKLKPMELA